MASKLEKIYVGAIVNRDIEVFKQIKRISRLNYNVKIVNLLKKGVFSVKYLNKKLKKYPFSLIIVKLYSEESNQKIYNALNDHAPNIPRLNSLKSVETCENRKATFKLIEEKCKKLVVPRSYYSINSAFEAVSNGVPLIIKLNTHNIRDLSKYDRIVGVAKNPDEFLKLIKHYDIRNNVLFFQEYVGKFELVHKAYVINRYIQTITSHNRLQQRKLSPLELVHIREDIDKDLKRRIRRLGKKFQMSIFGVDYVLKDGAPYIVDINDFPSFKHIPEGVSLISDYIYEFINARQNIDGKTPMSLKVKTYMA